MREALFLLVFVLATPSCLEGSAWAPPGCAPPHPLSPPCRAAGMVKTTTTIPPEEHQALRLAEQVKQARHESRAYSKALVRENNQTFHWDWAIPEGGYVQEVPLRAESALAFEFARRTMAGDGCLTEMQEALALVKAGEWGFEECEERFMQVFNKVIERGEEEPGGGLVGLPGVKAFNCLVEAAAIECKQGGLQGWQHARHAVGQMENLGCWPTTETFNIWLRGIADAAWNGHAGLLHAEPILKWMAKSVHVIHPADGVYRQAEALVGPIALPETSPPVVVVRTAVPVEAKTMNMMMEICAASVRQGRTGVTDAHAMIWDYGKHQVCPDKRSLDVVCEVVREACRVGRGTVWDSEELLAKMDWGRRVCMTKGKNNYASQSLGQDLFDNGTWHSDMRPDGITLSILLDALALQVDFDPCAGMGDARRLTNSFRMHCGVKMETGVCLAFGEVAIALSKAGRMSPDELLGVIQEIMDMGEPPPANSGLDRLKEALKLVQQQEAKLPPPPLAPPGVVRRMMLTSTA